MSEEHLFGSQGIPLRVREQIAWRPSGPVTAFAIKIIFTISGWARVYLPAGEVFLDSGSVVTFPAGVEARGVPTAHLRTVTLYIHPQYLSDQLRWLPAAHPLVHHLHRALEGDLPLQSLQLQPPAMRDLTPILVRLARSHVTSPFNDFALVTTTSELFDVVGRFTGASSRSSELAYPTGAPPRQEIAAAIALLHSDLARPWRIEDLAREVSLSASQLTRLFRKHVGISPAALLRQLRTDLMAELLATARSGVGEAAAASGWTDPAVASRAFKQRYGVTPRAFAGFHRSKDHLAHISTTW
ncbi:helix-turn-helix transcriptional regulator [Gulosibacter molinativorax]|nr:AraC family transcriptional regulator [Gulosibacter molinativorax]